jgi:hypothetical protein
MTPHGDASGAQRESQSCGPVERIAPDNAHNTLGTFDPITPARGLSTFRSQALCARIRGCSNKNESQGFQIVCRINPKCPFATCTSRRMSAGSVQPSKQNGRSVASATTLSVRLAKPFSARLRNRRAELS